MVASETSNTKCLLECNAKISVQGDAEKLFECFKPEEMSFERSSFTINKREDGLDFEIAAKDAVALRATINSITQLLTVFEGANKR